MASQPQRKCQLSEKIGQSSFGLLSRRDFLCLGAGIGISGLAGQPEGAESRAVPVGGEAYRPDFPLFDCHVHLDGSTIEQVADLSKKLGVRFGIVEHAGTKENKYPKVLSNDQELQAHLDMLEGKGVYRAVQAEWIDWASCFSAAMLAKLDYVLMDAMTFPGRDGQRVKLWEKEAPERVDLSDPERFMDRFVDWHVKLISEQPIDLLGNTSWLPPPLANRYDQLWTPERVRRVVQTAARYGVAIEISASYRLPKLGFLKIAKEEGVRFAFGTNGRYPNMGKLDYCLQIAETLRLRQADMFRPGLDRRKKG
ncbi:MAG: hypothetical protein NZ602_11240 [Thermoguttaceae bacterium]|nr:hypothetical protein [Thermoguttaceae bacterium]MDW8037886.1 hypothetical protein [Thermoguttaceae bacterium]